MDRTRFMPTHLLFLALVALVVLYVALPLQRIVPFPWSLSGAVPVAVGVVLNLVADRAFKIAGTTVRPFQESSALLTTGVFALTRNPMYLGFLSILLGLAILLGSLAPFAVALAFPVLADVLFIRHEERQMEETFGEEWSRYRARVRRWL